MVEADRAERRRLVLRLRNRAKQKRKRARFLGERERLLAQVAEMQLVLSQPRSGSSSLLPWKDVAGGLAQASVESRLSLEALRDRCERLYMLGQSMGRWVESLTRRSNIPEVVRPFTTMTVQLLADPDARRLGLDWYTQHLYHNTDRMLALCAFPSEGVVRDISVMDHEHGVSDILGRIQIDCALSLDDTYAALHTKIWDELRGDTQASWSEFLDTELVQSIDPKMVYRRTAIAADESNYYVGREFKSENRIVFLFGNFSQDELQPENQRWRPRMFWYVLERMGPTQTRIKLVLYNGPKVHCGVIVPWKADVDWAGGDASSIPEHEQFVRYQRWVNQDWKAMLESDFAVLTLQPH
ncbi:hypothetical protein ACHHYP_06424 [Achlya hypogyna]|uniref:BZIP domain-containing protein n=1 Tax=Achlya hypogyna TaxID=1202772 RepID=A0A1V9YUG6_ACHHY|nr:hypothetical protein ACHHYP_06424 [Achlya hypogyna]